MLPSYVSFGGAKSPLNAPAEVSLILRRGARGIGTIFSGPLQAGPQTVVWNGRFRRVVGEREYRADVRATSAVTTTRLTVPVAVDRTGPRLRLLRSSPLTFTVNEPGDVTVVFDGSRTVTRRRLAPGRFRIAPGGAFTSFRAVARDFVGNDGRALTYP